MNRSVDNNTENNELFDKVVAIKRVVKVVKGGRNMRFSALVVVGDKNGRVGAGLGKAAEIPEAIRKGKEDAIKNMVSLPIDENGSVPHDYVGKFGSAEVLLKKAPDGTGVIAGGPARNVLELAGYRNIRTKSLGSNNKQNVVLATINGLSKLKTPEEINDIQLKTELDKAGWNMRNLYENKEKEAKLKAIRKSEKRREKLLRQKLTEAETRRKRREMGEDIDSEKKLSKKKLKKLKKKGKKEIDKFLFGDE